MSDGKTIPTEVRTTLLYLLVAIQCAAAAVSIAIVIGLTVPLLIQLKNGSYQSTGSRRGREPRYSTHNLYLVYLALFDLVFLLPNIPALWLNANGKYPSRFYSFLLLPRPPPNCKIPPVKSIVNTPYIRANVWMNAVIAHEVFILLQATHRTQRVTQPSLTKANIQGGVVILGSILFGVLHYYNEIVSSQSDRWISSTAVTAILDTVLLFIPFVYAIGVTILVKWRGYLPTVNGSTPRDRAVRGLAFYFFRVIVVFVAIWLPAVVLAAIAVHRIEQGVIEVDGVRIKNVLLGEQLVCFAVAFLKSIQPIVSFYMILTKPDVKKYIKDLVTLSYLTQRCGNCCKGNGKASPELADQETGNERPERSNSISILGISFPDVDDDSELEDSEENADISMVNENSDADVETAATILTDTDDDANTNDEQSKSKATKNDWTDKTVSDTQSVFSSQQDLAVGARRNGEEEGTVKQGETSDDSEKPNYGIRGGRAVHRRIGPDGDIIVTMSKL